MSSHIVQYTILDLLDKRKGFRLNLKFAVRSRIWLAVLTVLAIGVSIVVIWNTVRLQQEVDERTKHYVSDVTVQLARDIDNRLSRIIWDLESVRDSVLQLNSEDPEALAELLNQKSKTLGFSSLLVGDTAGWHDSSDPVTQNFASLPGVLESLNGNNGVSLLDAQSLLYSIPLHRNDEVIGVLGGIRDKENMQVLIQPDSFSGEGLTCIVDCSGEVIISPTDLNPFMQLDSIFAKAPQGETAQNIYRMKENMEQHISGILRFKAVDGSDLILSYHPLQSYDWILLTLVPGNVMSMKMDAYMNQTFLIVIGVVIVMACILIVLYIGQRSYTKHLEKAAFVDRVTGGMNNTAFQVKCETVLPKAPANTYSIALLNIKSFKLINEQFGSEQGNDVLRFLMRVLCVQVSGRGFAARADADNFFLCLAEADPEAVGRIIDDIIAEVHREIQLSIQHREVPYQLILQPGVYIVDDPSLEITIIQDRAKTACRDRLGSEDGVCKFYDKAITRRLEKEQALNSLFEKSLANRDFQVYLQPKILTKTNRIGGAEALVRWQHPQNGMILPSDFIPLFEANGNICELDLYVFEEVCKTMRRWEDDGHTLFPISVNLSRQHFQRSDCLRPFADIARQYRIPAGILEFELTESTFFDDPSIENVKAHIKELHRLGFHCSLDDFGSGYSSLGLLMEFSVDAIKLDRRFFKDITNPKLEEVIASIVELSRKIGAQSVAEGIETPEQLALLKKVNCDMIQGYIYSKPLPIPEFEEWAARHRETSQRPS